MGLAARAGNVPNAHDFGTIARAAAGHSRCLEVCSGSNLSIQIERPNLNVHAWAIACAASADSGGIRLHHAIAAFTEGMFSPRRGARKVNCQPDERRATFRIHSSIQAYKKRTANAGIGHAHTARHVPATANTITRNEARAAAQQTTERTAVPLPAGIPVVVSLARAGRPTRTRSRTISSVRLSARRALLARRRVKAEDRELRTVICRDDVGRRQAAAGAQVVEALRREGPGRRPALRVVWVAGCMHM